MRKYCSGNDVFLSPKSSEDQKKKEKGLHRNLGPNSAVICGIYSCCLALFRLFNQRSNLDRRTLNLDGETLTLDGGTRAPYNLSTAKDRLSKDKDRNSRSQGQGHNAQVFSKKKSLRKHIANFAKIQALSKAKKFS